MLPIRDRYDTAITVCRAHGVTFRSRKPGGYHVYHMMSVLGYRWCAQTREWVQWRQSAIVTEREAG